MAFDRWRMGPENSDSWECRPVLLFGRWIQGKLIALSVDGSGRECFPARSLLDLSLYRTAPLWKLRLMMRRFPINPPQFSSPVHTSPLFIRTRKGKRQKAAALRRPIPQHPSVLGMSRVPRPPDNPVRRRGQHGGSAMRPFGLSTNFRREPTCRDIDHGCRYPLRGCPAHIFNRGNLRGLLVTIRGENLVHMPVASLQRGRSRRNRMGFV